MGRKRNTEEDKGWDGKIREDIWSKWKIREEKKTEEKGKGGKKNEEK